MFSPCPDIQHFLEQHAQLALVRIEKVEGSAPREAGAWMLVAAEDSFGTIGGGQLEYMAIDEARAVLKNQRGNRILHIPLGPGIGQCCGGNVEVSIEVLNNKGRRDIAQIQRVYIAARPVVYVFGAGHVGRALIAALALLPVRPVMIDTRATEMSLVPESVEKYLVPLPEEVVRNAQPASAFVVLTHDHSLDFLITREALKRGDAGYVGMIGSKTKRAVFERWCRGFCDSNIKLDAMVCPIGVTDSNDKRPQVIAAFIAAEVIDRLTASPLVPDKTPNSSQMREEIND
jgi:xanthine dehydrogenase accessory factor